ncbi:MAG: fatty acyl-AMP ligase [bacterium]|nr:fatty acyl-AMP ligase [bacterium]
MSVAGSRTILLPPNAVFQKPIRWLRAITRFEAHFSGGPNFIYELCVSRTTPEERTGLDLRSWKKAYNASEPIRLDTLERFQRSFAPHGFRAEAMCPGYGLAEATLLVSMHTGASIPPRTIWDGDGHRVSCSHPARGPSCVRETSASSTEVNCSSPGGCRTGWRSTAAGSSRRTANELRS